ncbi:MAG: lamin tail domain-containing protein [Bythopirellula sp.]
MKRFLPRSQQGQSLLFALVILLAGRGACAEVLISEIMYNPQGSDRETGQFNKEWIEIYNGGTTAVNLGGWTLEDLQDGNVSSAIPAGTMLLPDQALVLTGDAATFDSNWGGGINRLELGGFPTWANSPSASNEIVAIRDNASLVRDQVNYDDQGSWPADDGSDGVSIFLPPEMLSTTLNDDGANWLPGMAGVYGNYFAAGGGFGENHGSPGTVATVSQEVFAPSADAAWSMVILPDTQNYAKSSINNPGLTEMTQWISANRAAWNIQTVLHEGDIVNNNDTSSPSSGDQTSTEQWQNVKNSLSVLDGEVPYILATGNHDHGTTNAQNRDTQLNTYFSASDNPLVDPAQGGILQGFKDSGKLENAYYEIAAPDGRDILVVSLEWGPRQQSVAWANQIVGQSKFEDHTAILLTHAYMYHDETRYDWDRNLDADPNNDQSGNPYSYGTGGDTNDGQDLWEELVKLHGNFEFVFSGHVGGDGLGYLASTADEGNLVHQILFNTQFETTGGNGWLRVIEFLDDGETVRLRTFSPMYDLQRTDSANVMLLDISPLTTFPADFDLDGDVDADDLDAWQSAYEVSAAADADEDGDSDGGDFLQWQSQLGLGQSAQAASGSTLGSALGTVPEPATVLLLLAAGGCNIMHRLRERRPGCGDLRC